MEEEEEEKRGLETYWDGRMINRSEAESEGEEEREMNVPGLKQTDIREENGSAIMAEARNRVRWRTPENVQPSLIRKYNIERRPNRIKGRN